MQQGLQALRVLPVRLDRKDLRVIPVLRALQAQSDLPDHRVFKGKQVHVVQLVRKGLKVMLVQQDLPVQKERQVTVDYRDCRALMERMEQPDLKDRRVILVKQEQQVLKEQQALRGQQVHVVQPDLKDRRVTKVYRVLMARMEQ